MADEAAEGSYDAPAVPGRDAPGRAVMSADVSARDWTRTRTSDATTPPPPAAEAVAEAARHDQSASPAPTDGGATGGAAARRLPLLVQGLLSTLVGGLLAAVAALGVLPLAAAVLGVQVLLVLAVLVLLDAPAVRGTAVVAIATTLVADGLVLVDDGHVDRVTGAVGIGLVAALLHQLVRKGRDRVTEALADTLLALLVGVAAACLVALRQLDGGEDVLLVALAASAAALLVGRVGDRLAPRPALAVGSTRGWPGLVLALDAPRLAALSAALLGLLVAATVATADLAVDLGAAELRSGRRDARRARALRPTAALLPYALLGPVVLVAGRLVLS